MEKPNEHFDVQFTKDELRMLVRLVGHHVCGSAVDGIYNKLFDALFVHGQRASVITEKGADHVELRSPATRRISATFR